MDDEQLVSIHESLDKFVKRSMDGLVKKQLLIIVFFCFYFVLL